MSRRIRVLFAIGSLAVGGSERQTINILRRIDRQKIEPYLYLLNRSGEFLRDVPNDIEIIAFSDEYQARGWYFPGRIRRQQIAHLTKTLKQQRIDVLYDRTFLMPLITAPACSQAKVPRVSTIEADPQADLRHNVHRFRWLKKRLLTKAYREARCVIMVSRELGALASDFYGLSPSQLRVVYNGFDFTSIQRDALEPCPELENGHFNIVSVGRLQEQKAVDYLFHSVKQIVEGSAPTTLRIWILGNGPDDSRLRSVAEKLGLNDVVQFAGYQRNPYRWLNRAALFVLTSRSEGMPSVLIEAMACGVPVISTNCRFGPSEILNEPELGSLVPVDDPVALAKAIQDVINLQDINLQTQRARESVERRFGLEHCVSQLTELLLEVAKSRG